MSLISKEEAAKILKSGKRYIDKGIRKGLLKPQYNGKIPLFDINEVYELAELLKEKITLPQITMIARRADLSAKRSERVLEKLLSVLEIDYTLIPLDEKGVASLHLRVEDELKDVGRMDINKVYEWAKILSSIGEEYFSAVSRIMKTPEPWKPYLELSVRLSENAPHDEILSDKETRFVYGCLQKARNIIRQTAFFYISNLVNTRVAFKMFPEIKKNVHESILSIAINSMDPKKKWTIFSNNQG